ncbi:MAG: V-type ATPase subunit [Clostridia bacterium]|nr:V-type ATPase subunit [Clostridia bacterium]
MSTITAANAVLTKSRCMYGKRLKEEDYNALCACRSVSEVAFYLKTRTHYSDALQNLDEGTVHRRKLEELLFIKEFEEFARLCRYEFAGDEGFSEYIIMTVEIKEILRFLRLLFAGSPSEYLLSLPVYFASHSSVDLYALSRAKSFSEFLDIADRSRYRKAFRPFKGVENPDFVSIEHALYGYMYSRLLEIVAARKSGDERAELENIFSTLLDTKNFLHIYRLKKYYNSDENIIRTLLFGGSHKIKKDIHEAMITAPDAQTVLDLMKTRTPYAKYFEEKGVTPDNIYSRIKFHTAKKYIHYSVNPSVVMLSYIMLSQIELGNIVNIIECVRYGLPQEETAEMITV